MPLRAPLMRLLAMPLALLLAALLAVPAAAAPGPRLAKRSLSAVVTTPGKLRRHPGPRRDQQSCCRYHAGGKAPGCEAIFRAAIGSWDS